MPSADDVAARNTGDKVPFADTAAGTSPAPETAEPARRHPRDMDPARKRRHRWRAIYMLIAGGVLLTFGLWMLHS